LSKSSNDCDLRPAGLVPKNKAVSSTFCVLNGVK
jgi:hypothetical protein